MKNNNWYNHVQSQKDNFHPIQRYLADTARDERLINSAFSQLNHNTSKVVHTQHSAKQAQDASNRANEIKYRHMSTLNKAFLSQLQGVLPENVLSSIKDKHVNLKSPNSLGNNSIFNKILQNNPSILNGYDEIVSKISASVDPWVQQFVRSTNALIQEKKFLSQFNLSELFNYPNGGNGTSPNEIIECKDNIQEIVREFAEEIAQDFTNIIEAENQGSQGESPVPSKASSAEEDSQSVQVSNFTEEVISMNAPASSQAQSQPIIPQEPANNTPTIEELMARIRELEAVNSELQNKVDNSIDAEKVQEIVNTNDKTINDLKKTSGDKDKTISDQNEAMKVQSDENKELKTSLSNKDNQLVDSQRINKIQEKTIDGLEKDKSKLEKTNEKLDSKVDKLEVKVEDLTKKVEEKDSKITELQQAKLEELIQTMPKGMKSVSSDWDMVSDEVKSKSSKTSRSSKYKAENKELKDTIEIYKNLLVEKNISIDVAKIPNNSSFSIDNLIGQNEPEKDLLGASDDIDQPDLT